MAVWKTNAELIKSQPYPENPYFQQAYDFMLLWLSGQEDFALQTSGSTGTPKVIKVSRHQLTSSAFMTGKALNLGKGTRALVCLNVAYIAGLMMLVRGMELQWELTIVEPSSNPVLDFHEDPVFDFVAMVPLQLTTCLDHNKTKKHVNHFGTILLGGAPVSVSLLKKTEELTIPVYQSYGMTETVSHVALRKLNGSVSEKNYSVLPGVEWGIDDRGCLFVSGPITNGERIQTNDLVEKTSEKKFIWLGRIDNVINSGGVKIIPDRIDTLIAASFYELDIESPFFTWYEKDEKLGQKLILIIQKTNENLHEEIILEEIRKKLSVYEIPKHVYFADRFVKTETDKLDKRRTAQLLFQKSNG